ncbi:MAG TPA: hypothetical protein VEK55_02775, partial [Xanthobacteraceae bacterium]|nr:hypothetical protein [Xanthobacteraceae bacterium]
RGIRFSGKRYLTVSFILRLPSGRLLDGPSNGTLTGTLPHLRLTTRQSARSAFGLVLVAIRVTLPALEQVTKGHRASAAVTRATPMGAIPRCDPVRRTLDQQISTACL